MERKHNSPAIRDIMTHIPEDIEGVSSVIDAIHLMRKRGIRHLPVFTGKTVTGIVSDRDLKFLLAVKGDSAGDDLLRDVCSTEIYAVKPDATIGDVATHMHERKLGSALVMEGDVLVGIVTTSDILRFVAATFH